MPLTLMVLSPEADTMYLSSKSTTLTAARCPTSTRRRVMSVGEAMSHTAMDLSLEHVTMSPLLNLRCSTASLWWISVLRTSPVFTSHTLQDTARLAHGTPHGIPQGWRALGWEHTQACPSLQGWLLKGPPCQHSCSRALNTLSVTVTTITCQRARKETLSKEIIVQLAISHSKMSGYALNF